MWAFKKQAEGEAFAASCSASNKNSGPVVVFSYEDPAQYGDGNQFGVLFERYFQRYADVAKIVAKYEEGRKI